MIPVEEAQARVLAMARPLGTEDLALTRAVGRWLARPVAARADQPPFDASAMDGYALQGDPAPGDSFAVIGESGAGHGFAGAVGPGQAVRIFTGAPVPAGATRVVIQENVSRDGDRITLTAADRNDNIRPRGTDFPAGATLSPRRLRPADLSLLAAMNVASVPCARRPVVALLMTGDELVMPGEDPRPDQIIASNGFALKAMAEAEGAEARLLPIARDSEAALRQAFALAEGADILVTIGGASVGDHDLVGKVARDLGMEPAFWKIAMRPGKPLMAGRMGGAAMLGLPGNPVSAIVTGHLFLLPLIRAMQGDPAPLPQTRTARLALDLPATGPRTHYMRARLDGETIAPFDRQDSSLLTILTEADALLIRPAGDGPRQAGETVPYLPL
ncbi:molybdopterin molybdotransferase MoeA [Rhodobacter sp. SGA-6-6]|uniref:molybdopterin molybdotransferase MoeA n=1 Tax=Rhodobacter sp. SGA-6-6 TaxID=2710882 RepID=UPI0013ED8C90|nr:molybdopterin molybdotransferase MoeA [Rhodobacter sp. SGA-6-6]NGM45625.1 molybdopterin molybdotransferase MoeA [Rhodobacter sp. SGA-6-6]